MMSPSLRRPWIRCVVGAAAAVFIAILLVAVSFFHARQHANARIAKLPERWALVGSRFSPWRGVQGQLSSPSWTFFYEPCEHDTAVPIELQISLLGRLIATNFVTGAPPELLPQ